MKIRFVCATRYSEEAFYTQAALGKSLALFFPHYADQFELRLFAENERGLPSIYNEAIEETRDAPRILVFIHDDLFLTDLAWSTRMAESLTRFDIVGLAGNKSRIANQPSWAFVFGSKGLEWDKREHLSGTIAHGQSFPPDHIDFFGPAQQEVKLLDGVMLIAHSQTLIDTGLRFDPLFQFHFYDLDFCRQAELKGLTMGTWDISVVHQSGGGFGSESWQAGLSLYLHKWQASRKVNLYTIAYLPEQVTHLEAGYGYLDNLRNDRADWREYWPMRQFLLTENLDENAFYGFFSPRFAEKTGLSYQQVVTFVQSTPEDTDVVTFSPQVDIGAFFQNVFVGGDLADPGFLVTAQACANLAGLSVDLTQLVMDSRCTVFSNFFVAKPAFWRRWLDFCELLFAVAEVHADSELGQALRYKTRYKEGVERKVFVVEGVVSLLLALDTQLKIHNYNPFLLGWSAQLSRFREEAIICDALKTACRHHQHTEYKTLYDKISQDVIQKTFFSAESAEPT